MKELRNGEERMIEWRNGEETKMKHCRVEK